MDKTGISITKSSSFVSSGSRTSRADSQAKDGKLLTDSIQIQDEYIGSSSQRQNNNLNYDYSAKTNMMLIQLNDFCPYFCSTADLNGKQLKDLKKREIM